MGAVLDRARSLAEKVGDSRALLWATCYTGAHAQLTGDWSRALEHHETAIQIGRDSGGFRHEVSWSYARGAEALMHLGRQREAIELCRRSLAISLDAGNRLESGYAHLVLAQLEARAEAPDWQKAAEHLDASLKAFRDAGAQLDVGRALLAGAEIARRRGESGSRDLAETARRIFADKGAGFLHREAQVFLAEVNLRSAPTDNGEPLECERRDQ
jgi:tetratricopeptide (TPR) repeat protein